MNDVEWAKRSDNSLWVSEVMRKWRGDCEWQNKHGTTKTGGDTGPIRCDGVWSRCQNLSGTETILSYVKLTFKSTRGTDTIRKLAETDPKSALRLPKWRR